MVEKWAHHFFNAPALHRGFKMEEVVTQMKKMQLMSVSNWGLCLKPLILIIKECLHGSARLWVSFLMDAYCLKSIRMVLARGPDCFLSPLSVSLLLNTPTTTRTHMCANTNSPRCVKMPQTKTHTREGICASTKTPASQLALALISPWKRIVFKQDAFSLFIVSRPKPYQLLITACQIHRLYGGPSGKKGKKKKRFSE